MADLPTVIDGVIESLRGMTDLERFYDEVPATIGEWPAGIAYPADGEMSALSAGLDKHLHTINVEIHVASGIDPTAVSRAEPWPGRIFAALKADQTLGGTVAGIVWPMRYRCGPSQWNSNEVHYVVQCKVQVKTH